MLPVVWTSQNIVVSFFINMEDRMKKKYMKKIFKTNKEYFEFLHKNQNIRVEKIFISPGKIKITYMKV